MTTRTTSRSQSADATLEDVRAMLAAAEADDAVAHRLGRAYLARVGAQIAAAESRLHASEAAHHIRLAARLLHRREPAKLAHFVSPVPAHRVGPHATPPAPTAPANG